MGGKKCKLGQGRSCLDSRTKGKESLKIIKHLIRLPGEVIETLSWKVFKTQLDKALNDVV